MKFIKSTSLLFILCFLSLFSNGQTIDSIDLCPESGRLPYYRVASINVKDFGEIKSFFVIGYPISEMKKLKSNTGILTIRFYINCFGEIGSFDITSCDLNYKENEMSLEIQNYFLLKLKNLGGWKAPIDQTEGACNLHAFYSFRIVDGEIKEILPK